MRQKTKLLNFLVGTLTISISFLSSPICAEALTSLEDLHNQVRNIVLSRTGQVEAFKEANKLVNGVFDQYMKYMDRDNLKTPQNKQIQEVLDRDFGEVLRLHEIFSEIVKTMPEPKSVDEENCKSAHSFIFFYDLGSRPPSEIRPSAKLAVDLLKSLCKDHLSDTLMKDESQRTDSER